MTTPEKFRRRQHVELGIVVLLGIASVTYGVIDSGNERDRDACIISEFAVSNEIQNKRGELAEEAARLQRRLDNVQNNLITDVFEAETSEQAQRAFATFNTDLSQVEAAQRELAETRENTRIPESPTGTCD